MIIYLPVDELSADDNALLRHPNGREELDEAGMVMKDYVDSLKKQLEMMQK